MDPATKLARTRGGTQPRSSRTPQRVAKLKTLAATTTCNIPDEDSSAFGYEEETAHDEGDEAYYSDDQGNNRHSPDSRRESANEEDEPVEWRTNLTILKLRQFFNMEATTTNKFPSKERREKKFI